MRNRFTAKKRGSPSLVKDILLPVLLFFAVVGLFYYGLTSVGATTQEERLRSVRTAVTKATVQCYSIEGRYPPSLEYLEKHYGLIVDREHYIVQYDAFAENIMPTILVLPADFSEENGGLPSAS